MHGAVRSNGTRHEQRRTRSGDRRRPAALRALARSLAPGSEPATAVHSSRTHVSQLVRSRCLESTQLVDGECETAECRSVLTPRMSKPNTPGKLGYLERAAGQRFVDETGGEGAPPATARSAATRTPGFAVGEKRTRRSFYEYIFFLFIHSNLLTSNYSTILVHFYRTKLMPLHTRKKDVPS